MNRNTQAQDLPGSHQAQAYAKDTPNFTGAAHRLMWRDFHRLYAQKYGRRVAWLQGPARVERPWSQDPDVAEAWKQGKTGIPYIDACQRELLQTGWLAYKGRKTAAYFFVHDFAMSYGNWAVVSKIGNGGSGAWSGSGDVDQAHLDLRWKLRAELEHTFVDGYPN